jgi:hypothetical protein
VGCLKHHLFVVFAPQQPHNKLASLFVHNINTGHAGFQYKMSKSLIISWLPYFVVVIVVGVVDGVVDVIVCC